MNKERNDEKCNKKKAISFLRVVTHTHTHTEWKEEEEDDDDEQREEKKKEKKQHSIQL